MTGLIGWDVGGAHLKAALLREHEVRDAAQWPCPLWQGLQHLEAALAQARRRWPDADRCVHAVTMSGEMVDLFADREQGVTRIAALLAAALPSPRFFAGDAGWCSAAEVAACWPQVASANWLAAARHVAATLAHDEGLFVDIGSTTTDLVAFRGGRVLATSRSDAERLAKSELVYHGVVRTPLCALARRVPWRGEMLNVMNELFATTADVYRLTGELDPAHDQHPAADGAAKDTPATEARLARMIGLDRRDAGAAEWRAFAFAWREAQCAELREQLARVAAAAGLGASAVAVAAGCGAFLVADLVPPRWRRLAYGRDVARCADAALAACADLAAPAVAVGALFAPIWRGAALMWVVKLGGSLDTDPLLPQWLELLTQLGGGRVTLVCGGGSFAEEVRRSQVHWEFDDLAAHNMAVLAMAQSAYLAFGINPKLQIVGTLADVHRVLHSGHTALWLPMDWLRAEAGPYTNWDNSSDSIALDLARSLNAEHMLIVKSCTIDPASTLADLAASGVVDGRFLSLASGAVFPIDVLERGELARARSMLLGEVRPPAH